MPVIILAIAVLCAGATPAHADPISLTLVGINALFGTTLAASTVVVGTLTVGQVIGTTLALGGSLLASTLMRPGRQRSNAIDPSAGKNTFETSSSGEIRAIGRVRIGGVKVFGNTAKLERYRLIGHARGPSSGVEAHFLGGREVIVEENGDVSSVPYKGESAGSYVRIEHKPGDPADLTVWAEIADVFPNLWDESHKARGIAQTLIRYTSPGFATQSTQERYQLMYQSGPPEYERIQRGEALYDPRDGGTRWSDNGVLAVLHVLLGWPEFSAGDFDMAFIADEADRADEMVPTRAGSEPRSRAWGLWDDAATQRGELLRQLMLSTGCEIVLRPGDTLGIRLIDDERPAELTIATRHIADFSLKSGPESAERPNRCRVKYYAPERDYDMAEIALTLDPETPGSPPLSWSVAQDEIDRVGERAVDYELPFCPSAAQAQRITRRLFATARAESGIAQTNLVGLACWGARTVGFEVADLDMTLRCEVQPARVDDAAGQVEIPFIVAPDLPAWVPALHEAPAPSQLPDMTYYSQAIVSPATVGPVVVVQYGDGSYETRIGWDVPPSGVFAVEMVWRRFTDDLPGEWRGAAEVIAIPYAYVPLNLAGIRTGWRLRYYDAETNPTPWSATLDVVPAISNAAPAVPVLAATLVTVDDHDHVELDLTAPKSLSIVRIVLTRTGGPDEELTAHPGEAWERSYPLPARVDGGADFTYTATAYASDSTAGPTATVIVGQPAPPDP